jgi:hypothetical protein
VIATDYRSNGIADADTRRVARVGGWVGAFLAVLLLAAPALATNVLKIRVGNHPTYTRVVFELDGTAGYRMTRAGGTLTVTLDAGSPPRDIQSKSYGVSAIHVVEIDGKSVATVQLRNKPALIKEMILSKPSRIVLDLQFPDRAVAKAPAAKQAPATVKTAAATPKPAPKPAVAVPTPKVQPAPEVAKAPSAVRPAQRAPAKKKFPVVEWNEKDHSDPALAEDRAEARELLPGIHKRGASVVARSEGTAPSADPGEPAGELAEDVAEAGALADSEDVSPDAAEALATADRVIAESGSPPVPAQPRRATPKPAVSRVAKAEPQAPESEFDWMMIAAIAAAVVIVTLLVLRLARRRSLPTDLDVTALAADSEEPAEPRAAGEETELAGRIPAEGFAGDSTPMSGDSDLPVSGAAAASTTPEENTAAYSLSEVAASTEPDTGLFEGDESEGEKAMDMEVSDLPSERGGFSAQAPVVAAAGDSDVMRMVEELASRLATVESKLEDSNDARERLERQVAAQSEELRVQRAAIARTQRALRSLSRTDEDQATEPALKTPTP